MMSSNSLHANDCHLADMQIRLKGKHIYANRLKKYEHWLQLSHCWPQNCRTVDLAVTFRQSLQFYSKIRQFTQFGIDNADSLSSFLSDAVYSGVHYSNI